MKNNILIITGGTGGHVIPAEIFLKYLRSKKENVYILTDERGYKYIKDENYTKIFKIKSSHLSGNFKFKIVALIKLFIGFLQSIKILLKLKPKIVISFGSYASLSPLLCLIVIKKIYKTKLYIHEQNSVIGKTNKIFIKFSDRIFLNFERNYRLKKQFLNKTSIVGLPQQQINIIRDFDEKYNGVINFLVFAGSQGSLEILDFFKKIVNELQLYSIQKKFKFIVQSPLQKQNEIENLLKENNLDFQIKDFFYNFDHILNKTHIALCRSGAGTINDLIKYRIPAILFPLSHAKDNHQYENAKILCDIDCAMIINNPKTNIDEVMFFIKKVIDDKNFNKSLIANYNKIKILNASELMWNIIQND